MKTDSREPFFSRALGMIQAGMWLVFIWGPLLVAMRIFGKGGKEGEPQGRELAEAVDAYSEWFRQNGKELLP